MTILALITLTLFGATCFSLIHIYALSKILAEKEEQIKFYERLQYGEDEQ